MKNFIKKQIDMLKRRISKIKAVGKRKLFLEELVFW